MSTTPESINKTPTILALIALTLFIVAYFPAFQILAKKWVRLDEYTHAFFTVPIIIYMFWNKREFLTENIGRHSYLSVLLVVFSIIIYLISLQLQIPTITSLATVMTILSILVYLSGVKSLKKLITPIILLVIIIPIPNQIYSMLTLPLQLKASQASELIIRLLNVPVLREGNVIDIPGKSFQVVEACSGMRSIITLVTLSLIIAYFTLTKNISKLLLLASSIPVAFLVNIIRVVVMVLAFHFFKMDLTSGTVHSIMGIVIFGIALLILFMLTRILETWERKEKQS